MSKVRDMHHLYDFERPIRPMTCEYRPFRGVKHIREDGVPLSFCKLICVPNQDTLLAQSKSKKQKGGDEQMRDIGMMTDDELAEASGLSVSPEYWHKLRWILEREVEELKPAVEEYLSREDLMADAVVRDIVREYRVYQEMLHRIKTREGTQDVVGKGGHPPSRSERR